MGLIAHMRLMYINWFVSTVFGSFYFGKFDSSVYFVPALFFGSHDFHALNLPQHTKEMQNWSKTMMKWTKQRLWNGNMGPLEVQITTTIINKRSAIKMTATSQMGMCMIVVRQHIQCLGNIDGRRNIYATENNAIKMCCCCCCLLFCAVARNKTYYLWEMKTKRNSEII